MYDANDNLALLERVQSGDDAALDELVRANMGLVKSLALRFTGRGADYEDLVQLGTIGMLKAARNFDFEQNTRFSTYAVPLILGEIKRFLRDDGLIKVSRTLKRVATQIAVKKNVFLQEHKREPTVSELASLCGVSEEEIVSALEVSTGVVSLSEPRQDGTFCLEDVLGADNIASLVENVSLRQAVSRLPKDEKELIYYRYYKNYPQTQVAELLGVTQVKVSRTEKKIMEKLRRELG